MSTQSLSADNGSRQVTGRRFRLFSPGTMLIVFGTLGCVVFLCSGGIGYVILRMFGAGMFPQ